MILEINSKRKAKCNNIQKILSPQSLFVALIIHSSVWEGSQWWNISSYQDKDQKGSCPHSRISQIGGEHDLYTSILIMHFWHTS